MKKFVVLLSLLSMMVWGVTAVSAQTEDQRRGTIQGRVYEDVNGDGVCVDSGVEGENPLPDVNVRMTSSDEETVITHYSGPEGIYGLAAAGYSHWRIEVLPSEEWVVTSEPVLYAPIYEDSLAKTDAHFCLQKAGTIRAKTILPQSGASANHGLTYAFIAGLAFILAGLGLAVSKRA